MKAVKSSKYRIYRLLVLFCPFCFYQHRPLEIPFWSTSKRLRSVFQISFSVLTSVKANDPEQAQEATWSNYGVKYGLRGWCWWSVRWKDFRHLLFARQQSLLVPWRPRQECTAASKILHVVIIRRRRKSEKIIWIKSLIL